jgi:rhamnose transport system ATP-binding protein
MGLTGLVGAGRTEVCQAIFGIARPDRGKIFWKGKEVQIKNPLDAMRNGIGYLPEDRQKQGLVLQWAIARNISLSSLDKFAARGRIDTRKELDAAKRLAEKVSVKARSVFDLAASLSGGNQQKVVFAKLLTAQLDVLILDEPTKGVDVGAKSAIYEIICELASAGYGILLISSEMPEIIGMCDKAAVMRDGRITAFLERDELTQEAILKASMDDGAGKRVGA